jgi:hypothetical protein
MKEQVPWLRIFAEGVMIVFSILLAFGIDAWADERQEQGRYQDLLDAVHSDFSSTRSLLSASMSQGEEARARLRALGRIITTGDTVPADSVRFLSRGLGVEISFTPSISHYKAAIASGDVRLLKDDVLLVALNEFDEGLRGYERHMSLSGQMHFLGPTHDLRREFGSSGGFATSPEVARNLRHPTVRATVDVTIEMASNLVRRLREMDSAAERILARIDFLRAAA